MKMSILIPSESYRQTAGARIRYGRLQPALAAHGVSLNLVPIAQFDPIISDADILLISKCHDARATMVTIAARQRGMIVGVDLFDDYFSQHHDPRTVRFRYWITELSQWLSFALTSTEAMAEIAGDLAPALPVQLINDPAALRGDQIDLVDASIIDEKLRRSIADQRLKVSWFGIGDNPYFPVGLSDLSAYSSELAALARLTKFRVELSILTNARSLNSEALAKLATLPVPVEINQWSEEAESELLENSFACFLPVNAQQFSVVKSLNRAITALSAGCQAISPGYPLYEQLGSFIYRDANSFAADLNSRQMRVSGQSHDALSSALASLASAEREAAKLVDFLTAIGKAEGSGTASTLVVHGSSSTVQLNEFARGLNQQTVRSPFAAPNIVADYVATVALPFRVEIDGSNAAHRKMKDVERARPTGKPRSPQLSGEKSSLALSSAPLGVQMAFYEPVMENLRRLLGQRLGISPTVLSENSALPFLGRIGLDRS